MSKKIFAWGKPPQHKEENRKFDFLFDTSASKSENTDNAMTSPKSENKKSKYYFGRKGLYL